MAIVPDFSGIIESVSALTGSINGSGLYLVGEDTLGSLINGLLKVQLQIFSIE